MFPSTDASRLENAIPDYENYDYEREWEERLIEDDAEKRLLSRMVVMADSLLELGGGYGRLTSALEKHSARTFMVDYSMRNVTKALRCTKQSIIVRSDIRRLPFEDNSFDCIIAVRVLHHIGNLPDMLDEIVRVGRNGARVILGVPNLRLGRYKGIRANQRVIIGPSNHIAYVYPLSSFQHPKVEILEKRGLGLFDNAIGRRLNKLRSLSLIDVLTSRVWGVKPELFLKMIIHKQGKPVSPGVICRCGGVIRDFRCGSCRRQYGRLVDLVS